MNTTITLQVLMLNDLLNSKVIDQKIYNQAIQKITGSEEPTTEHPVLAATA
jgi:hypothetical protein